MGFKIAIIKENAFVCVWENFLPFNPFLISLLLQKTLWFMFTD